MKAATSIDDTEKIDFLKSTELCKKFSVTELQDFAGFCKFQAFQAGETVCDEDEKLGNNYYFYFVFKGDLQVTKLHSKLGLPKSMLINILKSGDSFGEIAILQNDTVRSASIKCISDSVLLRIEKQDFLAQYKANRKIADNLIDILIVFLKHSNALTRYVMFSSRDASCRLGFMLDFLREKYGCQNDSDSYTINLPFNTGLIADFLGMKSQLFSRSKKELSERGLISGYGRTIHIPDYTAFKAFLN